MSLYVNRCNDSAAFLSNKTRIAAQLNDAKENIAFIHAEALRLKSQQSPDSPTHKIVEVSCFSGFHP